MRKILFYSLSALFGLSLTACQSFEERQENNEIASTISSSQASVGVSEILETSETSIMQETESTSATTPSSLQQLTIQGQTYNVEFFDNTTVTAMKELLPLEVTMQDLHSNEKYYYFEASLPTNSQRISQINAGDIMLYGDDCLVIFYESFQTSYAYTPLGRVTDSTFSTQLKELGQVTIEFS
ncbi:cyclophilin-like fold protein [Enterococcus sp. HY326]|uniref:cyclophilin-like fold protein n=1 Tax=Enterococcus sp. HY326 TaxID=2971265 RepID=UPI00223ED5D2|nr:cyclophilin-like fold protein [Enterococcus sp. HY326]